MNGKTTAEELKERFSLSPHPENGSFAERHYADGSGDRPASGSIFYYVAPDEITAFHRIDCDEYWCYAAGSDLEVTMIREDGSVERALLGVGDGASPLLYVKKGTVFASRHTGTPAPEGTFLSCITVPRFSPRGFEIFSKEDVLKTHPELEIFYK